MTKVLLYSGGVDSYLISELWKPDVKLYIDIDGSYSEQEISRLPKDVKVIKFALGEFEQPGTKYIPMRNMYFLMIASHYGNELCFGATAGDYGAIDKRPEFIDEAERMLNYLNGCQSVSAGTQYKIEKRFVTMSKFDILEEFLRNGGTIKDVGDNTFSCFEPVGDEPCLQCKPCFRRFMLLYHYGYEFTQQQKIKMVEYIKKNVLPRGDVTEYKGTYFSDRIGEGAFLEQAVDKLFKEFDLNMRDFQ